MVKLWNMFLKLQNHKLCTINFKYVLSSVMNKISSLVAINWIEQSKPLSSPTHYINRRRLTVYNSGGFKGG